jgi:hypothetical protein
VIIAGDLFDDARPLGTCASQDSLREEHRGGRYFDSVIPQRLEWFAPAVPFLPIVAPGNHETAVAKRHDTNLISRFVEGLSDTVRQSWRVAIGGFARWLSQINITTPII